ncbi:hypothetical protein BDZ97DRAFT_205732 [Flammula alnicola]|nr:hypothetical protein BDZ97DRAFT_205732 [Flammula alnicola]
MTVLAGYRTLAPCQRCSLRLVMGTGNPRAIFCRPAPVPAKTRTRGHGYRILCLQVRVCR